MQVIVEYNYYFPSYIWYSRDELRFEDGYTCTNDRSLNTYIDGLDKDYVLTSSERDSYSKFFTSILILHSNIVQNECIGEGESLNKNHAAIHHRLAHLYVCFIVSFRQPKDLL